MSDWTPERIDLVKNKFCVGGSSFDLKVFIATCQRLNLAPEEKHIYAVFRGGKMSIQVSIDGYRLVAERTGKYEGQTPPQWCGKDGLWKDVWVQDAHPMACRVGVFKRGFKAPMPGIAHFKEFKQSGAFWDKMPKHMIAKVAEALAIRKAFPEEFSGTYTEDEMPPVVDPNSSIGAQAKVTVVSVQAQDDFIALEQAPTQNQIILPVLKPPLAERIPRMLEAFNNQFGFSPKRLEAMMHKSVKDFEDKDMATLEQIFLDLVNNKLQEPDLESIKEVLGKGEEENINGLSS